MVKLLLVCLSVMFGARVEGYGPCLPTIINMIQTNQVVQLEDVSIIFKVLFLTNAVLIRAFEDLTLMKAVLLAQLFVGVIPQELDLYPGYR